MALWPNPASAQLLVNKSFTPVNTVVGQTTILTIEILNNTTTIATNVTLTDNLPASPTGLTVAVTGALSNSCGGTVTAVAGTTTVSLAGGTIAAATTAGVAGSCSFTVQAVGSPTSPPASFVNTIPAANVSSSIGGTGASASATLTVAPLAGITGSKTFADANVHGNGPATRMTIQLNNSNAIALTGVAFTDSFPTQLQLASVPNATNGCGGTLTATGLATSLILSGGTIPAAGNCTISVDTVVRNPNTSSSNGTVTNSIAANGVTSTQGARNAAAISGSLPCSAARPLPKPFRPLQSLQVGQAR
jgi:uncharacterized repeat protein (TIGR01451 family)